ncbi:hypothetical protein M8818_006217 [Zalaria obscura]|uniref:Uncharacterized protein n=1 Tax=Zalaria obscura TaxID=2024903 RepID=A0ACC3SAE5_9PEZI
MPRCVSPTPSTAVTEVCRVDRMPPVHKQTAVLIAGLAHRHLAIGPNKVNLTGHGNDPVYCCHRAFVSGRRSCDPTTWDLVHGRQGHGTSSSILESFLRVGRTGASVVIAYLAYIWLMQDIHPYRRRM